LKAKKKFLAAFGLLFVFNAYSQEDFEKTFSAEYKNAAEFVFRERWITRRIERFGLQPKDVLSVVFPELIRFNSIQDRLEIFALESLYVKYGRNYANFSVGPFQVKPSFAETLETDFIRFLKGHPGVPDIGILPIDTIQNEASRLKRLARLKDIGVMTDYLCSFYRLMEKQHSPWANEEEKIKFIATAYNCGYRKSAVEIQAFVKRKFFYTGWMATRRYSYADVSWYYFKHH